MRVGGPYEITFSFVGYESKPFNDVYLTLGKSEVIKVELSEGEQLETIVITGSKSNTFNSYRTGAQTGVGRRELTRQPTISRPAQDFTRLEPAQLVTLLVEEMISSIIFR